MSATVTNREHWREVYRQQRLKNAHLWLEEFERASNPVALATANYDKLLQAIEQTLKHEDSFSVGCDLLREITPIAFGMADWGRLLIYLKGALKNSRRHSDRSLKAYLHEWIADIQLSLTKFEKAELNFQNALQLYLTEGETARFGRILPRMARIYAAKGQFAKAIDLSLDALNLGQGREEPIIIADAHHALADFYLRQNDWEQALIHSNRACFHYKEIGKQSFVFRAKVTAVVCLVYLERYEEAEGESDQLLALFNESENAYDNLLDSIYLRRTIGFMAFRQGDYFSAETHWQEAYNQTRLVRVPDLAASISNNLGKVYTKLGEFEAAEEMLSEALTLYEQLGDMTLWANGMDNLADLYEEKGDLAACKRTLKRAIAHLEPEATMAHSRQLLHHMQQRLEKIQAK